MLYYYGQRISWRRWAWRGGLTLASLALPALLAVAATAMVTAAYRTGAGVRAGDHLADKLCSLPDPPHHQDDAHRHRTTGHS